MNYKATISFAGQVCMAAGEMRDLPDEIATPLLRCGYLTPVAEKSEKGKDPAEGKDQAGQKAPQK